MTAAGIRSMFGQLLAALERNPSVTDWIAAVATALTLVAAVGALILARGQIDEARRARALTADLDRARTQPYVVMFTEPSGATPVLIDLVVKNFGQSAATNVRIDLSPWPSRTKGGGQDDEEEVAMPEVIPILAPGQEWRTLWDNGLKRKKTDLPDKHVGTVSYEGLPNADGTISQLATPTVIDWSIYKSRRWVEVRTAHDSAKSLREIERVMSKWTEGNLGPLSVIVRDGNAKDLEDAAYMDERLKESEAVDAYHAQLLSDEMDGKSTISLGERPAPADDNENL
jgi:hypothetical protein